MPPPARTIDKIQSKHTSKTMDLERKGFHHEDSTQGISFFDETTTSSLTEEEIFRSTSSSLLSNVVAVEFVILIIELLNQGNAVR